MQIVTEIYTSPYSGSTDYIKLDLYQDEAINIKYTLKDVTDLSKVFAPYSLSFTVQATPKNRAAFGQNHWLRTVWGRYESEAAERWAGNYCD